MPQTQFVKRIIVPVARPETAVHMLELATSLVDPEHGQVLALIVSLNDSEQTSKINDAIAPIVQRYVDDGHQVVLINELATSISRGILDAARDSSVDLIILGVQKPDRRQVRLGTVVENVIEAAPCDVLIYRLSDSPEYSRVVVPVDGTPYATIALNLGVLLARQHHFNLCPMYVQHDYQYDTGNENEMRAILAFMGDEDAVQKEIITGYDPAYSVLRHIDDADLLVLGFSQSSTLDWRRSTLTRELLNRAPGPVLLTSRFSIQSNLRSYLWRRVQRFQPVLTTIEGKELIWQAHKTASSNIDYAMMILLSAGIASLGLLLNSVAVIIGAMLVAPLMQPLSAFAVGLVTAQADMSRRAALTLIVGVCLALLISVLFALALPVEFTPTPEMTARGNPSLLDAAVALVSGLVAAYATARKGIPAALAGVAIAAALMPPLCTVGLGLALGNQPLALGASLLFVTNILFIILAEAAVFLWLGLRPRGESGAVRRTAGWWAGLLVLLVFVIFSLVGLTERANERTQAEHLLVERFAPADLLDFELSTVGDTIHVDAMLRSQEPVTPLALRAAQDMLAHFLDHPVELEVVVLQAVRAESDLNLLAAEVLAAQFEEAELADLLVDASDELVTVTATLRAATAPPGAQVNAAQMALAETFGQPVALEVIVLERIAPEATADAP